MTAADFIHLMQRVAEVYTRHLRESSEACACLEALNLGGAELLEDFNAGYSDGTLPQMLGGEAIEALRSKELLTEAGEETLRGCVVVPVRDPDGVVAGFCGLKLRNGSQPEEILVPKSVQGLVRGTVARDGTGIFIATQVVDALSL